MSFAGDLQGFATKTGIRMDQVVRKVCLDMTKEIVMATPVDTGMARSNFFFGIERVSTLDPTPSKSGALSFQRAGSFASTLKAGGVFYITNNLPYIMQLEYGSSTQAPAGMVRITVSKWQTIVNKAVAAL